MQAVKHKCSIIFRDFVGGDGSSPATFHLTSKWPFLVLLLSLDKVNQ